MLPGGLGRFVPCSAGANHCGHGLTSRPRESASEAFLDELLQLFQYPPRSSRALLAGTLPLRYCAARFACWTPLGGCLLLVMLLIWLLVKLVL